MYPLQLLYGAEWGEGARGKGVVPIALCTPAHLCQNASLLAGGLLSPNKTGVKAFARQNKGSFFVPSIFPEEEGTQTRLSATSETGGLSWLYQT